MHIRHHVSKFPLHLVPVRRVQFLPRMVKRVSLYITGIAINLLSILQQWLVCVYIKVIYCSLSPGAGNNFQKSGFLRSSHAMLAQEPFTVCATTTAPRSGLPHEAGLHLL